MNEVRGYERRNRRASCLKVAGVRVVLYIVFKGTQQKTRYLARLRGVKIRCNTTENENKVASAMFTRRSGAEEPTTSSTCAVSVTLSASDIP